MKNAGRVPLWVRVLWHLTRKGPRAAALWLLLIASALSIAAGGGYILDAIKWRSSVQPAIAAICDPRADQHTKRTAVVILQRSVRESIERLHQAALCGDPQTAVHARNALSAIDDALHRR